MIGGGFLALTPTTRLKIAGRLLDLFLAFPPLLIAMALAAVQKPGLSSLVFAMTLGALPAVSRMIYVRALEIVSEDLCRLL